MLRIDQEAAQRRVVDVREQRLVEVRPVPPIEDLVRNPASEQPPDEVLASDVRKLELGREAQEELEEVDVRPWPARLHAANSLADRLGLGRDARADEARELERAPALPRRGVRRRHSLARLADVQPGGNADRAAALAAPPGGGPAPASARRARRATGATALSHDEVRAAGARHPTRACVSEMLEQEPVQREDELGMLAGENRPEAELADAAGSTPRRAPARPRDTARRRAPPTRRGLSSGFALRLVRLERHREPVGEELDVRHARRRTGSRGIDGGVGMKRLAAQLEMPGRGKRRDRGRVDAAAERDRRRVRSGSARPPDPSSSSKRSCDLDAGERRPSRAATPASSSAERTELAVRRREQSSPSAAGERRGARTASRRRGR